jgi:hypothetical protein
MKTNPTKFFAIALTAVGLLSTGESWGFNDTDGADFDQSGTVWYWQASWWNQGANGWTLARYYKIGETATVDWENSSSSNCSSWSTTSSGTTTSEYVYAEAYWTSYYCGGKSLVERFASEDGWAWAKVIQN